MPDIAPDIPSAFVISQRVFDVDRISMELQRNPYTQNTSGLIRLWHGKRVSDSYLAEAIRN